MTKRWLVCLFAGLLPGGAAAAELPPFLIHVLDGHGRPLAGAVVRAAAEPEDADHPGAVIQEKTGPDGTARLSGLPDDRIVWVLAEHKGFSPGLQSFTGATEARRERRIVLAPGTLAVGRVVDEKGRPVVGAEAELTGDTFGLTSTPSLPAFLRERPKVRTGPAGRFRFRDLPAGRYELRLSHSAFAPLVADRPVQGGRSGDLGRFILRRGAVLTGTVTDPDGRPVAGMPLWVMTDLSRSEEPLSPTATTGTDGGFAIPGLPPGELAIYTCGQGYHQVSVTVHFLDAPVHLTVRPAATLRGRVLGPDGEPLAGARLSADQVGVLPGCLLFSQDWTPCPENESATSDADGRFVVGPLAAGWYDLMADARGMRYDGLRMLRVAAGEPGEEVEIRLQAGGTLSGRVLDTAGAPVAGAHLSLDGPWSSSVDSARDGSFSFDISFDSSESDPVVLAADKCGYEPLRRELEDLAGEVRIDLVLAQDSSGCPRIRGRVIGPDGAPVERALVTGAILSEQAWTAADGAFELPRIEGRQQITAEKPGFATARRLVDSAADPLDGLEIRLERGAVVSGRILGLSEEDRISPVSVSAGRQGWPFIEASVAGDGTFRAENVPSGTWELYAQAGPLHASRTVAVEPGQAELSVDLEMPAAHTVSGQVLDDRALPVAGATIAVEAEGPEAFWETGTRADGSFAMRLPDGTFSLYAFKDGFLRMEDGLNLRVEGGPETDLEIRLEPAITLRGRLFGLAPGERPGILAEGPGRTMGAVELDSYSIADLKPGRWRIEASLDGPEGKRVLRRTVEIPPGATVMELDLDFAEAVAEQDEAEP